MVGILIVISIINSEAEHNNFPRHELGWAMGHVRWY